MNQPKDEADRGFIVPDPSAFREDAPGDAGDEASEIRFSEEQALIEEQVNAILPDTYNVPPGGPTKEEARGNMDLSDQAGSGPLDNTSDDSSDDGMHGGANT